MHAQCAANACDKPLHGPAVGLLAARLRRLGSVCQSHRVCMKAAQPSSKSSRAVASPVAHKQQPPRQQASPAAPRARSQPAHLARLRLSPQAATRMPTVPPTVSLITPPLHGRSWRPPSLSRIRSRPPQTGSVSEADYEALVLKLHDIQVGGGRRRQAAGTACRHIAHTPCCIAVFRAASTLQMTCGRGGGRAAPRSHAAAGAARRQARLASRRLPANPCLPPLAPRPSPARPSSLASSS